MIPFDKILEDFATAVQIPKDILSGERINKMTYAKLNKLAHEAEPVVKYLRENQSSYDLVVITIDGVALLSTEGYMPISYKEATDGTNA